MEIRKIQALYGLKYNPFTQDIPGEALQSFPAYEQFYRQVEDLVMDGGFAACMGEPGLGKSVVLRMISERLVRMPNVIVGEFTRPQCSVNDFYREAAEIFRIPFSVSNRYLGHQGLRKKWKAHIESTLLRPVILIDEAQALNTAVFNEIKSLSSEHFDSQMLVTVILSGDMRLAEMLETQELKPIGSRLRYRLTLKQKEVEDLEQILAESISRAGAPGLITPEAISSLAEKSMGNMRTLMTLANTCLVEAVRLEVSKIDEKLFLELMGMSHNNKRKISNKKSI